MSAESTIFLHDRLIRGQVTDLEGTGSTTIALITIDGQGARHTNDERFTLFVPDDRRLEVARLFHKIAQDLAALLPDVDACCRCVPGTPDDQCAEHGYGAHKIKRAASECPLCGEPSPRGEVHLTCAHREQYEADRIPIEEAAEHVEPPHRWG